MDGTSHKKIWLESLMSTHVAESLENNLGLTGD